MGRVWEGRLNAEGMRFILIAARFNSFIVDRLVEGAKDALIRHGADPEALDVMRVPGAFELPAAARQAVRIPGIDAVLALGAVIRGSTPHFDYVAAEAAKGIAQIGMAGDVPVAFGVLTCDTLEQAIERAGAKAGNKGWDAALTAIEMASLFKTMKKG